MCNVSLFYFSPKVRSFNFLTTRNFEHLGNQDYHVSVREIQHSTINPLVPEAYYSERQDE